MPKLYQQRQQAKAFPLPRTPMEAARRNLPRVRAKWVLRERKTWEARA